MVFGSDQRIKSFARDLAKLCIRVDTKRAQGSSDPRLAAMKRLFQDKLAELAKAIGSQDGAEHLVRRYIRELQEETARRLERVRSHRGQEQAVTLARRWIDAWQSNRLTRLLSLFDDDGSYVNTILKISARGKRELGGPFGRMLHVPAQRGRDDRCGLRRRQDGCPLEADLHFGWRALSRPSVVVAPIGGLRRDIGIRYRR